MFKNKAVLNLEQCCIRCYVAFDTASTVTNQTHFQVAMYASNTVFNFTAR